MTAAFPLVPLHGSSPLIYLLMAAVMGAGFGFFLERSGFGSAKRLTAVFTLRDWQVYRVMFTALVTAMIGAQLLAAVELLDLGLLELSTTYLWPMSLGGILFGVGFYVGGFCPGTAVVSVVSGRLDGLVFLVGIVLGIYGFALFFDGPGQASWFQSFYLPVGAAVQALDEFAPAWVWVIGITAAVILSFVYLYIFEQRFAMLTPEQLKDAGDRPPAVRPRAGRTAKVTVALATTLAVGIAVLQIGNDEPTVVAAGSDIPAAVAVDSESVPVVDSLSLVGWIVSDAHRLAADTPPNCHVLDLRTEQQRAAIPIRGTLVLPAVNTRSEQHEAALAVLDDVLTTADKNKPLVIVDSEDSNAASDLVADLRVQGLNALLLDGGAGAWQDNVLSADSIWPEWVVGTTAGFESPTPIPGVAVYHDLVRSWMTGNTDEAPAYMSIPGTVQLPSEAATVVATGSGGGGCG